MKHEYWQHCRSGEVYAVRVDDDGTIVEATTALYYGDVRAEYLEAFSWPERCCVNSTDNMSADDMEAELAWFGSQEFRILEPPYPGEEEARR